MQSHSVLIFCCWTVLWSITAAEYSDQQSFCGHPLMDIEIQGMVHQNTSDRIKRSSTYEPIRITFSYDDTFNTLLTPAQRNQIQTVVIPSAEMYFESTLSVIRTTSNLLLDRSCNDKGFLVPVTDPPTCYEQCIEPPTCGPVKIPDDHLKECVECNTDPATCATRPTTVRGAGVPNTDLIIYVSINCSDAPSGVVAFAGACQMESQLDRPIAGMMTFCPPAFTLDNDTLVRVVIHEVFHVLGFSSDLYRWYRDENGNPRTPRDGNGFPPSKPSTETLQTETYTDWSTKNGLISHQVTLLVTPNVLEQARLHYNCSSIIGVEVENQGGEGTAASHWEQRIMGNEGMTGFLLFSLPFSRISLGLLEDSGWYKVDYNMADALAWGFNSGCTIPHGSCREYITQQQESGESISPYCDEVDDTTTGCTLDHEYLSRCNLRSNANPPAQFQFFNVSAYGGGLESADYCPLERNIPSTRCLDPSNNPMENNGGQFYGAGSRCFQLGSDWIRTDNFGVKMYTADAGCYQYACTSSGVEIFLEGMSFLCSYEGEEIIVDITMNDVRFQGSYICPSCASVCYDNLDSCLALIDPNPCNSGPCDVNAECTITGLTLPEFNCSCNPGFVGDGFICSGMTMGADPHFSVVLPSKKLLCFSIMGEQGFSYNLISNSKLVMNALFSPDSKKDGVTWIGALGIIAKNSERANQVAVSFTARQHRIEFNKVKVSPENIGKIRFKKGQVYISDRSSPIPHGVYPSVLIIIEDVGVNFTVHFMNEHLDLFWHNTSYHNHTQDFHGLIGQFFRKGVEIDTTRKIIILPNKEPVPVIRRPLWSFMEREPQHDQFCWTAMNAGHQGKGLIEGEYNDYLVDNIGTDHFKFAG